MRKEHETARTRVLSDEEIRTLINGFDQTRYGRALRLLFLTALRRDEVLGLKWSWIDLERGVLTIPPSAEKGGRVREELRRTGLERQTRSDTNQTKRAVRCTRRCTPGSRATRLDFDGPLYGSGESDVTCFASR